MTTTNNSILTQIRSLRHHKLATLIGLLVGSVIPIIVYRVAHVHTVHTPALWLIVAGGLLFSGTSVYTWALKLWDEWYKALGFTILLELTTVFVNGWESWIALTVLILINSVNMAHALVVGNRRKHK